MTRGELKTTVRTNLADAAITFYSENDLDDSIQDAYDDIVAMSKCILKKVTSLTFEPYLSYYDFSEFGIADYMGTVAIFNNTTKRWLVDDCSLKDFDRMRRDWEKWTGQPQFWAPSDPERIAIVPKSTGTITSGAFSQIAFTDDYYISSITGTGTFDLYYWAIAPTLTSDSDTFLISSNMQVLLEYYVTGDLIEQATEYTKALGWWTKYYPTLEDYTERVSRINKSDLLLRV